MAYVPAGRRRHLVTLQNPDGTPVSDGDGSFTQPYADCAPPALYGSIETATAAALGGSTLEHAINGTLSSSASHVITIPFHRDVTTQTRVSWVDRSGRSHTASITGVSDPEQANVQLVLVAVEIVQ